MNWTVNSNLSATFTFERLLHKVFRERLGLSAMRLRV